MTYSKSHLENLLGYYIVNRKYSNKQKVYIFFEESNRHPKSSYIYKFLEKVFYLLDLFVFYSFFF